MQCVYYEADTGVYIDKPKTESSVRWIRLPEQTMQLLKEYKEEYYEPLKAACGENWQDKKIRRGS